MDQKSKAIVLSSFPDKRYFRLLYRGSECGYAAEAFHKRCDNRGPTLTICKSEYGKIFGLYTDIPWESTQNRQVRLNRNTFKFTMGVHRLEKFYVKPGCIEVVHTPKNIVTAVNFSIKDQCNLTVENQAKISQNDDCAAGLSEDDRANYLAGAPSFRVIEIEVF